MRFQAYLSWDTFLYGDDKVTDEDCIITLNEPCSRAPADMLYIHGDPADWARLGGKNWIEILVLPYLVDQNPARIVWCND